MRSYLPSLLFLGVDVFRVAATVLQDLRKRYHRFLMIDCQVKPSFVVGFVHKIPVDQIVACWNQSQVVHPMTYNCVFRQ